jgi:hypothetical protein
LLSWLHVVASRDRERRAEAIVGLFVWTCLDLT